MEEIKNKLTEEFLHERFPELWKYILPEYVTDVDYNCGHLWISTTDEIPHNANDESITESYMRNVAKTIALCTGKNFTEKDHILCADTETLRVTCVHESVSGGLVSVNMRKEDAELRFTMESAIKEGFCDLNTFHFIKNCVFAGVNLTFCGNPGAGKTECLKNFSSYIPNHEKVIPIEDVSELHYHKINPLHNCIEMKVGIAGYQECIDKALRMNPTWILFGEALGEIVKYLLQCWTNGVSTMCTLHVNDARSIPDKMVNSIGISQNIEHVFNQVYDNVGIAVLLKKKILPGGKIKRYIDQVCLYYRLSEKNHCELIVEDGNLYPERVPEHFQKKIEQQIGRNIFSSGEEEMV